MRLLSCLVLAGLCASASVSVAAEPLVRFDLAGRTLVAASTTSKATPDRDKLAANAASAKALGALAAQAALGKGIKQVVFDRSGARYHGKVKALADAAREAGLKF